MPRIAEMEATIHRSCQASCIFSSRLAACNQHPGFRRPEIRLQRLTEASLSIAICGPIFVMIGWIDGVIKVRKLVAAAFQAYKKAITKNVRKQKNNPTNFISILLNGNISFVGNR
jgi:hypothetical protein